MLKHLFTYMYSSGNYKLPGKIIGHLIHLSVLPSIRPSNQSIRPSVQPSVRPWLYNPCGSWPLFQFRSLCTLGRLLGWGSAVARPLITHRTTQTQNECTQISVPQVGFEPTIPVFERAKTVHALDRAAAVVGTSNKIADYLSHQLVAQLIKQIGN
jgi:hypothetical protein